MREDPLLRTTLELAVPLWVERLRALPFDEVLERARVCAQHVAAHGDRLMFRGKRGESAEAFNRLAEGVAALSFAPGGVKFLGLHFEEEHPGQRGGP